MKQFNLSQLNEMEDILNLEFLHNYEQINGSSLFDQAHQLFSENPRKIEKRLKIQQMILDNLNNIQPLDQLKKKLLFSHKKTENSMLLKKVIFKDHQAHKILQSIRQKVMKQAKSQLPIEQSQKNLLRLAFYIFGVQFSDENFSNFNKIKKNLITLRKLLGNPAYTAKTIKGNQKQERFIAYQMNLDFKSTLMRASDLIQNDFVKEQFQKFLSATKNKKWIGCRFFKGLNNAFWTLNRLKLLYKAITSLRIKPQQIQSDYSDFLDTFGRMKINMKSYIKKRQRNITKVQQNVNLEKHSMVPRQQQVLVVEQIRENNPPELKQIQDSINLYKQGSLLQELCQMNLSAINFINFL